MVIESLKTHEWCIHCWLIKVNRNSSMSNYISSSNDWIQEFIESDHYLFEVMWVPGSRSKRWSSNWKCILPVLAGGWYVFTAVCLSYARAKNKERVREGCGPGWALERNRTRFTMHGRVWLGENKNILMHSDRALQRPSGLVREKQSINKPVGFPQLTHTSRIFLSSFTSAWIARNVLWICFLLK